MGKPLPPDTGFAARLRGLRGQAGLTLAQLADRSGIHLQSIAKMESGRQVPSWPTVLQLAEALGVDCLAFQVSPTKGKRKKG